MKIVEVTWTDIEASGGGWLSQNKLDKFITEAKNRTVKHVGYLYEEEEAQIVLVDSVAGEDYGTCTVIPKGCITKITELSIFVSRET